ncbi:MAG TPA: hypothetical protein DCZ72_00830 [Armatimonadetes bacterium]|nr:hypothetical protein [Armatimonadota bacterium]
MVVVIECACGAKLKTTAAQAGKSGRCPKCGAIVTIPATPSAEPPPVEAAPQAAVAPATPPPPSAPAPEPESAVEATSDPEAPAVERRPRPKAEEPVLEPWQVLRSWQAHDGTLTAMTFAGDGRFLVTGGADRLVRVWDLASGAEVASLGPFDYVPRVVRFCAATRMLAVALERAHDAGEGGPAANVLLFDLNTREQKLAFSAHRDLVLGLAFNTDGSILATGGDCADDGDSPTICFWQPTTGEPLGSGRAADTSEVRELTPDPLGRGVYAACWQTITRWEWDGCELKETVNSGSWDQFRSLSVSPDGRYVAGGCFEYLRIWDLAEARTLGHLTGYNADVTSTSWAYDSRRVVGASNPEGRWEPGLVMLWDALDHRLLAELTTQSGAKVIEVRFVPKRPLIVGGDNEGAVSLWGLHES